MSKSNTRAKFRCIRVTDSGLVTLDAVQGDSEENKNFWEATPAGSINMSITNKSAIANFKEGSDYYVDFTEVTK